jgi:predicted metal-dependent hydrolase
MFATLFGMVRSMLNEDRVPMLLRRGLWAKAARTATDMWNYLVSYKSDKSSYEKFMGVKYDQIDTLHTFSEMAIVEDHCTCGMHS